MLKAVRKISQLGSVFAFTFCTINVASADDTDLYLATSSETGTVKPNLMFIIDSSGSMSTRDVEVETLVCKTSDGTEIVQEFDASITYPGSFDDNRIYFFNTSFNPSTDDIDPKGSFLVSDNHCSGLTESLSRSGISTAERFISYQTNKWKQIEQSNESGKRVECLADQGTHGQNNTTDKPYPQKGKNNTLWTDNSKDKVKDKNYRDNRKVYSGNRLNYEALLNAGGLTTVIPGVESCEVKKVTERRIDVVKAVASEMVNSVNGLNMGVMRFNTDAGGFIVHELVDVNPNDGTGSANRDSLLTAIDNIPASGFTPLGETMYEAVRYFRGDSPFNGSNSVANAFTNSTKSRYDSPITDSCQAVNHVILLSDGVPFKDDEQNSTMETVMNQIADPLEVLTTTPAAYDCKPGDSNNNDTSTSCLVEVARFASNNDLSPLDEDQYIELSTIGFTQNIPILNDAASEGNGRYFQANNVTDLVAALDAITGTVLSSGTTFLSPAVSVNAFNRLQHNDEIYYALFAPNESARWDGNLKHYRITSEGVIIDDNGQEAIDSNTGFFRAGARSIWSLNPDGANTASGGARDQLPDPDDRNVYTFLGDTIPTDSAVNLTLPENTVSTSNTGLTEELFGASNATELEEYIKWTLGKNTDNNAIEFIGDPLHSRPIVVVYGARTQPDGNGGTEEIQDTTVFFGTNEGFLHAMDGESGTEEFAFIPRQLLANIGDYAEDTAGAKIYGLDGEVTIIKNDLNNNGVIYDENNNLEGNGTADEESVYLYIGMRRGGRDYFAFDVTDRSQPKLMWQIKGGEGEFAELGQSWSRPVVGEVNIKSSLSDEEGTPTQVLFFGGGYDTDQDSVTVRQTDTVGRSVYMVNAKTGELLWSAGPNATDDLRLNEMQYSTPAELNIADVDGDGYTDIIFASNVGGEVWRFDLADAYASSSPSSYATGGKILSIAGTDASDNRRFFVRPDVSLYAPRGEAPYFIVAIGSGERPDPLNDTVENRFYALREFSPYSAPTDTLGTISYETATESDLFNTTPNTIQDGTDAQRAQAAEDLADKEGWYINLSEITVDGSENDGEKVLASSLTIGGVLLFTTFTPGVVDAVNQCGAPPPGISQLYALNVLDGSAAFDQNGDGVIEQIDREGMLQGNLHATSSLSELKVLYIADETGKTRAVLCSGPNCSDELLKGIDILYQDYWREDQ